ncbi:hypothetical protein D3C71_1839850 [compost metagenome]
MFQHPAELLDTFSGNPRSALQHQLLGGLDHQIGGVEQPGEFNLGLARRSTARRFQADLTGQRNLERLEIDKAERR